MSKPKYQLRPHHLLCTLAFKGKGYTSDFVKNYQQYVDQLNQDPSTLLQIQSHTDVICSACPHQRGLLCESEEKVQALDQRHAQMLNLIPGEILSWQAAKARLAERAPNNLDTLCHDCEWLSMGICMTALSNLRESSLFCIWNQIKTVSRVHKKSTYRIGGFSDQLSGTVTLLERSDLHCTFLEEGTWLEKQLTAQNQYVWKLEEKGISLYRQQQHQLVRLCHFTEENQWSDTHLCGQDIYQGTLVYNPEQLNLNWRISGPKKEGTIECYYR